MCIRDRSRPEGERQYGTAVEVGLAAHRPAQLRHIGHRVVGVGEAEARQIQPTGRDHVAAKEVRPGLIGHIARLGGRGLRQGHRVAAIPALAERRPVVVVGVILFRAIRVARADLRRAKESALRQIVFDVEIDGMLFAVAVDVYKRQL